MSEKSKERELSFAGELYNAINRPGVSELAFEEEDPEIFSKYQLLVELIGNGTFPPNVYMACYDNFVDLATDALMQKSKSPDGSLQSLDEAELVHIFKHLIPSILAMVKTMGNEQMTRVCDQSLRIMTAYPDVMMEVLRCAARDAEIRVIRGEIKETLKREFPFCMN